MGEPSEVHFAFDFYPPQSQEQTRIWPFFKNLKEGRLTTTKCTNCGALLWQPRVVCPACNGDAMAWVDLPKNGTLYATTAGPPKLVAWSGWNGSAFTESRVVWSGPKRMPGLNGLTIGWDGRIYAGVGLTDESDHAKSNRDYAQSVISMRLDGSDVRTVAQGLRQPWQLAFVKGVPRPYVTVLGQENLGKKQPPDYVILAKDGEDYGFPACNWSKPAACAPYAKPFALFPAHSSPTGIAARGSTLYVGLFNGTGRGPEVVALPARGGRSERFLTGFAAPVVAVGVSGGHLYAGDLTGSIYRVKV